MKAQLDACLRFGSVRVLSLSRQTGSNDFFPVQSPFLHWEVSRGLSSTVEGVGINKGKWAPPPIPVGPRSAWLLSAHPPRFSSLSILVLPILPRLLPLYFAVFHPSRRRECCRGEISAGDPPLAGKPQYTPLQPRSNLCKRNTKRIHSDCRSLYVDAHDNQASG